MKIMSKTDCEVCDCLFEGVKRRLEICIERMKGKYGAHEAVCKTETMICLIKDLISNKEFYKSFYQKFRTPPNTPKSRRLGWHKKGG